MRMIRTISRTIERGLLVLVCLLLVTAALPARPAAGQAGMIREGNDYATQVLRDPWDMNEFTDISQYLNNSGQSIYIQNIQVANGIFSASSATTDPQFTALFPGYNTAMLIGKTGHNFPIQSSVFKCFHIALNSNSTQGDNLEVYWFKDERLNGGAWGTTALFLNKAIFNDWQLHTINLTNVGSPTKWNGSSTWQGLRIDPSVKQSNFSIDWIRLTDCNPVNFTIPGLPAGKTLDFYLNKNGHDTLIKQGVSTGSPVVDLQGVEAGTYTYKAKEGSNVLASGSLTINQAPIATFTRPSMSSGADYAETSGTSWNMSNSGAVTSFDCITHSFSGGVLNLATAQLACSGDPKMYLNSPQPASTGTYRYLSMKMDADGPWQNVPGGMIARLVWKLQSAECNLVSQDIPFEVGWNTYHIDLYDAFNGSIEQKSGNCPGSVTTWQNTGTISSFRFDPNENELGRTLNQKIEWIRLTAMDRVSRGSIFPVSILLNKPLSAIPTMNFYYTTTRSAPTQHPASGNIVSESPPVPSARGPFAIFLPAVSSPGFSSVPKDTTFNWNTGGVAPGQYYLCVSMNDGLNTGTYCSDAPVAVQ